MSLDSDLFKKSLEEGALDITVSSILFTGCDYSDCVNAKHVIFQEPITSSPIHGQSHEIYFRPHGHPGLKKLQHDSYSEVILYCANYEETLDLHQSPETSIEPQSPKTLIEPQSSEPLTEPPVISETFPTQDDDASTPPASFSDISTQPAVLEPEKRSLIPSHYSSTEGVSGIKRVESNESKHSVTPIISTESFKLTVDELESDLKKSANFDNLMKHMVQNRNKGRIEMVHVFHFQSYYHIKEILKLFMKNVTFSIVVSDTSEPVNKAKLDQLKEMFSFSSKTLTLVESNNATLEGGDDVFSMNYRNPDDADHKLGASIIDRAFHSVSREAFPFSWYIFGFKLYTFMTSHNISALSVSRHAMLVAEKLNMDRPTVEAALEHLTTNNVVLYFGDILPDVVFVSVDPFSMIFSEVFQKYFNVEGRRSSPVSHKELALTIERHADHFVSVDDFILLFRKLMILAPYKTSYMVPSFLPLLSESERKEAIGTPVVEPLFIKCPFSGYEFISMLTVYLLTMTNTEWEIFVDHESSKPACWYKNCAKFYHKKMECFVTLSFSQEHIEIYYESFQHVTKESQNLSQIITTILHGLEIIRLRLSCHPQFNFCSHMSFQCHCGEGSSLHTAVYDKQLDKLVCTNNASQTPLNDVQRNWLKSGKVVIYSEYPCYDCNVTSDQSIFKDYLTVGNAIKALTPMAEQWVRVSKLLRVPDRVVDSILVSRLEDRDSLRRLVEWWFKNTPNPEWTAIQRIRGNTRCFVCIFKGSLQSLGTIKCWLHRKCSSCALWRCFGYSLYCRKA